MAMTWTDIAAGLVAAGAALRTSFWTALRNNDEANSSKPLYVPIDFTKSSAPASYPGTADAVYYTFLPEDAKVLRVRGALWVASGTGYCKIRVEKMTSPAGNVEQEQSTTATAKGSPGGSADKTWTLSGLDNVSGQDLRGQDVKISLFFKASSTVAVNIESVDWPPSKTAVS